MANTRQILQRRNAVDSISRVTRTLEMVSTARYKLYANKRSSIVDYHDALTMAATLLSTAREPIDHPLLTENTSGCTAILALGSRKGLCGSYNNQIIHLVKVHQRHARMQEKELFIYVPGGRLEGILKGQGIDPTLVFADLDEMPTQRQIGTMVNTFIDQYMLGEIDSLGIVYMRYFSASNQHAQTLTLLPLLELVDDLVTRSKVIWPWDLGFEDFEMSPSADRIIEELVRMLLHYSIQSCLIDAALSEHLARMVAMRNATESADDMIKELSNEYNRARQTQITGELMDIVCGTEALG
jgi:F-type H+-transporting ATPase subunit gamma